MTAKKVALWVCALILAVTGSASAYINWSGAEPNDNSWATANNWVGGVVPTAADEARIMIVDANSLAWPMLPDPSGPVIDGIDAVCDKLTFRDTLPAGSYASLVVKSGTLTTCNGNSIVGRAVRGMLVVEGGELYFDDELYIGERNGGEGVLNMSGGLIDNTGGYLIPDGGGITSAGGHLVVGGETGAGNVGTINLSGGTINTKDIYLAGGQDSQAVLYMTGGTIDNTFGYTARSLNIAVPYDDAPSAGTAHVQLNGGTIIVTDMVFGSGTGTMDIAGGTLVIEGDEVASVTGYVNDGKITGYGFADPRALSITYDGTDTTVIGVAGFDPGKAYDPSPIGGGADYNTDFSWISGDRAATEEFYLSTNEALVAANDPGVKYASVTSPTNVTDLMAGGLELDTDYYWKVNTTDSNSIFHEGDVWAFSTRLSIRIDDFETYADTAALQVEWPNATALVSTPANDAQAMRFDYDLSAAPFVSEVIFVDPNETDWTIKGMAFLRVRFFGDPDNSVESLSLTLEDQSTQTATVTFAGDGDVVFLSADWYSWDIPLSDFAAVDLSRIATMTMTVGDGVAGGAGTLYIDSIALFWPLCLEEHAPMGDITGDCVVNLLDFEAFSSDWLEAGAVVNAVAVGDPEIGWWKFDETAGSVALDSAGTDNGALTNFPDPNGSTQWVAGQVGNALSLTTADNFVHITDTAYYGDPNELGAVAGTTWAAWIKTASWRSQVIMGLFDPTDNPGYLTDERGGRVLYINREGSLVCYGRGVSDPYPSAERVNDGQWHHVAVSTAFNTSDLNDTMIVFIDGVEVSSYAATDTEKKNVENGPFVLAVGPSVLENDGRTIFDRHAFDGLIDDVRIYNRALTQGEVISLTGQSQITQPINSPADIANNDEKVDMDDLAVIAAQWLLEQLFPAQ